MDEINLQNKNGQAVVSSRDVAEKFKKRHDHILRDVDSFKKDVPNFGEMFFETEEPDRYGRMQRCFDMNRDGFSLLAMGFTGKKALEWKLKYIEAFNKMEETLKSSNLISEEEKLKLKLFSKDPMEVAMAHNQLVELATVPLLTENKHKQDVINGLTNDIPLYEKADIINRVCKRSYGGYANRYNELYKCFKENFHKDLIVKCKNYNDKQIKKKDELSIIRYAEKFDYIDELYTCCVKLYESEIKKILDELNELHK